MLWWWWAYFLATVGGLLGWLQVYLITLGNANSIIKAGVVFRKEDEEEEEEEEEEGAHTYAQIIAIAAIANLPARPAGQC